jgi:predicted metal-dependent phosphoesterase TrpH
MAVFFDLHMHTSRHSPDSVINPFSLMHRARELKLDGIVITEHDFLWTEDELRELRAAVPSVKVFGGVEVSAKEGHFLCYGVTDPTKAPMGIGVADLCQEVHRQGGAVVAAHPFRWNQPFQEILDGQNPDLDGLEVMSGNMDVDCRRQADQIWRDRKWSGLGNSDAHVEDKVGTCYTEFAEPIRDLRDLIDALRGRATTPHDRVLEAGVEPVPEYGGGEDRTQ